MSTRPTPKPEEKIDPNEVFTIDRTFKAPRDLVFAALTQADHLAHWWGPAGFTLKVATLDLRPGGLFHYSMQAPAGHPISDAVMWGRFVYQEIVPPERIVFINSFSDAEGNITVHPMSPTWPRQVLSTITLTEHNHQTTVSLVGTPYEATEEERHTFAANHPSMQQGFGGTFAQLDTYLATLKP